MASVLLKNVHFVYQKVPRTVKNEGFSISSNFGEGKACVMSLDGATKEMPCFLSL